MVWFKVDDKFHGHRKVRSIGRKRVTARGDVAAVGLWTLTGTWSADHLEDGFVPAWIVEDYDPKHELAALLVRGGLWSEADKRGEAGYLFHDWDDANPTREKVEAKREADRERLRAWRAKQAGHAASNTVTNRVANSVSNTAPDPTRPDPTRVLNTVEGERPVTLHAVPATQPPEKRTRCIRHPNGNPDNEACAGCRADREHDEREHARHLEQQRREAEARALACTRCDGANVIDPDTKLPTNRKCDHRKAAS